MRLSLTNILGVLFSLSVLVFGVTEVTGATTYIESIPALSQYQFLNIPSFFIVIGGVLNAVFITYQPRYVGKAFFSLFYFFSQSKTSATVLEKDLENILNWNEDIRDNRVQALSKLEEEHQGEISGFLFSLVSTNYDNEEIRDFGSNNIEEHYYRSLVVVDVLRAMGGAAPSFGMFGTLFGLIVMLGELENPSAMGPGLAAALITTLYGISLARFVFYPVAEKIKNVAQMNRFREYFILEGVLLINEKKSSFYIKDKLKTYLQRDFDSEEELELQGA
ncbi:MAG: MotA/TolQ/ExbB proton channel family protein [Gracilimonas sp.]|jgi:chemotaxis protein MotA|nr:MotA/TolQ/ExbB proton channel family protein [Gracilimonas sp.]